MIMTIDLEYEFGETVYIRHDTEQNPYVVVQVILTPEGKVYNVNGDTGTETVYEIELSRERNEVLATR